jgi:hypothetical protein
MDASQKGTLIKMQQTVKKSPNKQPKCMTAARRSKEALPIELIRNKRIAVEIQL